jgi:hypothetical protein
MENALRAIEVSGTIDDKQQLHLDEPLGIQGPTRVKVVILVPDYEEVDEIEWARAASKSPSFAFLNDPAEDIYTLNDGKPFHYEK